MSRKPRVQRTPEEKWQIVLEGLKSGNVAETCRKYEIAPNLRVLDPAPRTPREHAEEIDESADFSVSCG
jgi:hypothetical protein